MNPEPVFFVQLSASERQALADLCLRELSRLGCEANPAVTSAFFRLSTTPASVEPVDRHA